MAELSKSEFLESNMRRRLRLEQQVDQIAANIRQYNACIAAKQREIDLLRREHEEVSSGAPIPSLRAIGAELDDVADEFTL